MHLTRDNKPKIALAVLGHAFTSKLMTHALERQQIAYKAYDTFIGNDLVNQLKMPWVTTGRTAFMIRVENEYMGFDTTGKWSERPKAFEGIVHAGRVGWWSDLPAAGRKIVLPNMGQRGINNDPLFDLPLTERTREMLKEYQVVQGEFEKTCSEIQRKWREIFAILDRHRTVKKLLETWPEVEPFIPETADKPVNNLPATRDLNAALGLPV